MEELDLLILGAGWTATFLIPLLQKLNLNFAATTTDGHPVAGNPTIPFKFDPFSPDQSAIAALPRARNVLITFPLVGSGPSELLVTTYEASHRRHTLQTPAVGDSTTTPASDSAAKSHFRFIQLGSTGIWQGKEGQTALLSSPTAGSPWLTRHSPYDTANHRAVAEDELLSYGGCVLELAGLWGGERLPRGWILRVAGTKDAVRAKKSLHLIHGADVARAVVAVVQAGDEKWESAGRGQRWMLTDGFVYDWWALLARWAEGSDGQSTEQARWVYELMAEEGEAVRALPRSMELLERCYDTREFWETFGLVPLKGGI